MGSLKTLTLAGMMALGASAASAADFLPAPQPVPELKGTIGHGWYLRADIGVGSQSAEKYYQQQVIENGGIFFNNTSESAFFGGIGFGYRFNNWLRFDLTGEYRGGGTFSTNERTYRSFDGTYQTNTYKGNLSSLVTLFNAYVDLGTWKCLTPYLGAGIGVASNRVTGLTDQGVIQGQWLQPSTGDVLVDWTPTLGTAGTGTSNNLAWALMAGIGYEVSSNLTIEAGYRYLNLGDARSGNIVNSLTGEMYSPLKAKNIDSHDFRVGMRWNFGSPDCCGPKEVAYQPPVVRKY